ncbi:MAG TPA: type II toxin-antitoxin system antitoxin SocA domain-containing protein [Candidatus Methylacidiphilales bacterium]|nr:type II toxin-antitoxin system antitoxin SocA domain-containing protein [Candidatus Methylacidiphilales bacterium]
MPMQFESLRGWEYVELKAAAQRDEVSDAEVALLEEIFQKYGAKSRWELVDLTHQLPEWQDPQGGAIPITYWDILKAAGKTDLEAAAIEGEIRALSAGTTGRKKRSSLHRGRC